MALGAIVGVVFGAIAMGSLHTALGPLFNKVNQMAYNRLPNELVPPGSLVSLLRKGMINEGEFTAQMRSQGYDTANAGLLHKDSESILNAFDAVSLWRRGAIADSARDDLIKQAGWEDGQIDNLVALTEFRPSAMDVVRFATREVYSPEIAERFGQYKNFEAVASIAKADIEASGVSKETFKKYWAAHWALPGIHQGFEMLHRKVVEERDLEFLMEAADVMPFWRDKLMKISYSPYTRVDVRRMHKMGILSESELLKAYMDLGYDPEKAGNMVKFTVAYNDTPPEEETTEEDREQEKLKEATRASVMKAFRTNIIAEDEARGFLEDLKYKDTAIELYLANEAFALEEDITDLKIKTLHEAFIKRIYTYNDTVAGLGKLNLPAKQQESLLDRWTIELEARGSRPSKKELFTFFKAKIITEETLRHELKAYGFNDTYIKWYMQGVGVK